MNINKLKEIRPGYVYKADKENTSFKTVLITDIHMYTDRVTFSVAYPEIGLLFYEAKNNSFEELYKEFRLKDIEVIDTDANFYTRLLKEMIKSEKEIK